MLSNPAGQAPATPSTTAPAGSRGTGSQILLPPGLVAREFDRLFRGRGMAVHPAEVRQLATRFVADGHERLEDAEAWVLTYRDPVGEAATRNVDRERGMRPNDDRGRLWATPANPSTSPPSEVLGAYTLRHGAS